MWEREKVALRSPSQEGLQVTVQAEDSGLRIEHNKVIPWRKQSTWV